MPLSFQQEITILHVDDEPEVTDMTATFLEREDDRFAVETATSADEGLQRITDRPPDCVVSDYNMPGKDGLDFLQAVRAEYPDLPFILFTGKGSETVASDAIAAGVTDYLQKGSGTEQYELLANRIENAVANYRSQRVAEQRKERLELFFQESPLGAIQWDESVRVERLNDRAEEILGYDEAELVGESWETIVAEDDRDRAGQTAAQLRSGEGGRHAVHRTVRSDGEIRTIEWHNRTVTGEEGTVDAIFSKFQDITDRKERQQELEEYETILEALTDAVYVLDEEGRFTYVNDEFLELIGYDRETILGSTPSLIKDEEAVDRAEHQLGRLLSSEGPETVTFEVTLQSRDGDPIVCEDHMGVLPYEGDQFNGSVGTLRDITDQKARKRELEAVKSQYETLLESYPDGAIFLYDTDLRVVRAGGNELSEVGLSLEEIEGTTPQERYPQEIAAELVDHIENALAGESHTFEQEYRGEHYRVQTVPVRTGETEITHAMAVSQNITDQVQNRRELERQNELFGKAQAIADVGAWAHDTESGTLTWTDHVYEMHGVSNEFDPSLDDVVELYHPDDRPKLREAVDQAVTAGEPYDLEVRLTARDDGTRWFRTVAEPEAENGDVVRVRGIVHDITDRVERERELRQYEHFFKNSPDQIALLDEDLTVQYQSPPSSLHELDAIEVEGDNPLEYVHPDDRQRVSNRFAELLTSPDDSVSEEFRVQDVSGEWRWVETRAINLLDDEPADGILVVIRDITRQKQQRLELERQNDRLDEFASIVSHDLRNPLSVAAGRLELAQETCESDHLEQATDAVDRSQALIDDLLTLARDGSHVDETESVALTDVATDSWQSVDTEQATLDLDAPQAVEADRSRLRQLFENLYRNAVEHAGDDVTVAVGATDDGFYVADTGPGIPESDREQVFEAGYSTNENGTGFGLRIVEQIADAHGWDITVAESEQGGTLFAVTGVEFVDQ